MTELEVGVNTYATYEELLSYLGDRYYSTLLDIDIDDVDSDTEKKLQQALIMSYDTLSKFKFAVEPVTEEIVDDVATNVAEDWIIEAQCLEAVALLIIMSDDDALIRQSLQMQGIKEFTFDRQREEFKGRKQIQGLYSKDAFTALKPYLLRYPTYVYTGL